MTFLVANVEVDIPKMFNDFNQKIVHDDSFADGGSFEDGGFLLEEH